MASNNLLSDADLAGLVNEVSDSVLSILERRSIATSIPASETEREQGVGRPRCDVDIEEVEYLRSLNFSTTKIARMIGVSRSTLYRRFEMEGLNITRQYSTVTDSELDGIIQAIKQQHPNDGERLMIGHLYRTGVYVPRSRVRASIHRVDPINTSLRRSVTVRRRVYHADGPNSVWHIDGHHKLIKWRFVTHGGVDGYSRTATFLKCSTNNKAQTMLNAFIDGVLKYGLPNKIRSDLGGENVKVWQYMIEEHNSQNAVIVGSSTHNERIERLWRDVHRCVSVLFADMFRAMEENGILDCLNEIDMFCLHTVFLPRINEALQRFIETWNNHPMSSASNLTPNQQFIQGALSQNMSCVIPTNLTQNVSSSTIPAVPNTPVSVPRTQFQPCDHLSRVLSQRNMLLVCDDFGYSLYEQTSNAVGSHLQNCSVCMC